MAASECLPGSSECDGDLMKVCELGGVWVTINCPDNTKCGLDDNKITCKPLDENISSDLSGQNGQGSTGENNGQNEPGQNQPEPNNVQKDSGQNNDQNKPGKNNGQNESDQNGVQNGGEQQSNTEGDQGQPGTPGGTSPEQNQANNEGNPEQPDMSENKPENNQQLNGNEQNKADEIQKPPNESIPTLSDKKYGNKTVYVIQTVTEKESRDARDEIEKSVLNKLKDANLPCCDEDLDRSCRICKDSRPIRAIVIDRESLLGDDQNQKPQEENPQQASDKMGQSAGQPSTGNSLNGGDSKPEQSNPGQAEDTSQPQTGESPQNEGQQSSGPPKKPDSTKNQRNNNKFLSNNNHINNSHGSGLKNEILNDKTQKLRKSKVTAEPQSSALSSGQGKPGGGKDEEKITAKELEEISIKLGDHPRKGIIMAMEKYLGRIKGKSNQAMFIAQIFHESDGLKALVEIGCDKSGAQCGKNYDDGTGAPGKQYYGRGLIQLSWAKNYKAASEGLGMGDKLWAEPDQVAKDNDMAAQTAVWYWLERVANAPGVKEMKFGSTTKAINGELECKGSNVDKSKARWKKYLTVAEVVKPSNKATEDGCY